MYRIALVVLISSFAIAAAVSQESCETKAVDKTGKALVGAAKTSFIKKCKQNECAPKAVDKDGKKLAGAAKNSFMKKCESGG